MNSVLGYKMKGCYREYECDLRKRVERVWGGEGKKGYENKGCGREKGNGIEEVRVDGWLGFIGWEGRMMGVGRE